MSDILNKLWSRNTEYLTVLNIYEYNFSTINVLNNLVHHNTMLPAIKCTEHVQLRELRIALLLELIRYVVSLIFSLSSSHKQEF